MTGTFPEHVLYACDAYTQFFYDGRTSTRVTPHSASAWGPCTADVVLTSLYLHATGQLLFIEFLFTKKCTSGHSWLLVSYFYQSPFCLGCILVSCSCRSNFARAKTRCARVTNDQLDLSTFTRQ